MTKFEEELYNKVKVTNIELTTEAEYKKSTLINHFKNWHSDEEFQELLDKYSNLNDNYEKEVIRSSKLESQLISREKQVIELREADKAQGKEIIQLKSQLQQQALPVVPECVAEFITKIKKAHNGLRFAFNSKFNECPAEYWNEAIVWRLNNPDEFARAWLDGYQVEKPQLFYLKNKIELEDVGSDLIGYLNLFLTNGGYLTNNINRAKKFTQQEINSMETGSYEQIEVEE